MPFGQIDLFYTSAIRPSTVIVSMLKYQLPLEFYIKTKRHIRNIYFVIQFLIYTTKSTLPPQNWEPWAKWLSLGR